MHLVNGSDFDGFWVFWILGVDSGCFLSGFSEFLKVVLLF